MTSVLKNLLLLNLVIFLTLAGLSLAVVVNAKGHICTNILSGRFDGIKSFTWWFNWRRINSAHLLALLEGDKNERDFNVYHRLNTDILQQSVPFGYVNYDKALRNDPYKMCLEKTVSSTEKVSGLFWFREDYNLFVDAQSCHLFTEAKEYSVLYFFWQMQPLKLIARLQVNRSKVEHEYSLVYGHGSVEVPTPLVYAIYRESVNNHDLIVIHMVMPTSGKMIGLHYFAESPPAVKYYSFEMIHSPDEVLLVHRNQLDYQTKVHAKSQLFQSVPRGFVFEKRLYLFESTIGCVYIITGWDDIDLDKKFDESIEDLKFGRINRPYEEFFNCTDNPNFKNIHVHLNSNRCNTIFGNSSTPFHLLPSSTSSNQQMLIWIGLSIGLVIVFIVLFIVFICGLFRSSKKPKNKATVKTRWFRKKRKSLKTRNSKQSRIHKLKSSPTTQTPRTNPSDIKWFSDWQSPNSISIRKRPSKVGFAASYVSSKYHTSNENGNYSMRGTHKEKRSRYM